MRWGKERSQDDSVVWSLGHWKHRVCIYRNGEDCRRSKIVEEKPAIGYEHTKIKKTVGYMSL